MQHCPPRIIHQAQYTVPALITIEDKVCNEQKHLLNFMWQVQYCLSNFMFWVQLAVKKCAAVYIKRGAMVRLLIGTPRPKTDTCRHAFLSHLRSLSLYFVFVFCLFSHTCAPCLCLCLCLFSHTCAPCRPFHCLQSWMQICRCKEVKPGERERELSHPVILYHWSAADSSCDQFSWTWYGLSFALDKIHCSPQC